MSSLPTDGKPDELLKEYKGLNDQNDSVKRPKGTTTDAINLYDEQGGSANRRAGREFSSLSDGNPIGTIFNLTWSDGSNSTIQQTGTSFGYDAFTYPSDITLDDLTTYDCSDVAATGCPPWLSESVNPNTGDIMCVDPTTGDPVCPPSSPSFPNHIVKPPPVPDFVPIIRALAEAYYFSQKGISALTIPNHNTGAIFRKEDTTTTSGIVDTKADFLHWLNLGFSPSRVNIIKTPPNNLTTLPLDYYYVDYVMNGISRAVSDLNALIRLYNSPILTTYLKTDLQFGPAPTSLTNFTSGDAFQSYAVAGNYKTVCAQFAGVINGKLIDVKVAATQSSLQSQTQTKQDAGVGTCDLGCGDDPCALRNPAGRTLTINGYADNFFHFSMSGCGFTQTIVPPAYWIGRLDQLCIFNLVDFTDDGGGGISFGNTMKILDSDTGLSKRVFFTAVICYTANGDCTGVVYTLSVGNLIFTGSGCDGAIWIGTKTGGATPSGTYTQTGGCDTANGTITLS